MPSIRKMRASLDLRVEFFEWGLDPAPRSTIEKAPHWHAVGVAVSPSESLPMPPAAAKHLRLLESTLDECTRAWAARCEAEILAMELQVKVREQQLEAHFAALEDAERIAELVELVGRQADELRLLRPGDLRLIRRQNRLREELAEARTEYVSCHSEVSHEPGPRCMARLRFHSALRAASG
ncbi:hypothetical protein GLOTRDRAFT_139220 [Gloeophyllum trabeum ATCC 11539]|uniref:Uncharacterized protein n=1 Tax=Gloeophyllum trabeum (strain ATCC 11539 / FP-39264 / Madison 617) TaxID=670483 RepID=S7Q5C5_GLOTA|nr:uncharacterized protein GLOTRDRAFT_139220 [Gloeophyllum trabeum ATCC 11539]EPQ54698.1 hypothetical protein GLOTRDRAFT_139220 [Gloeophyllum trabeum ATCC 11539]